jgi:excinuclease UvrABC nuclease subunit
LPFQDTNAYEFGEATLGRVLEVGGVYGLAKPMLFKPGWYTILYVGKASNLKDRLNHWFNNPPATGITHFFADRIDNEALRTQREAQLIAEFKPVANTLLK